MKRSITIEIEPMTILLLSSSWSKVACRYLDVIVRFEK